VVAGQYGSEHFLRAAAAAVCVSECSCPEHREREHLLAAAVDAELGLFDKLDQTCYALHACDQNERLINSKHGVCDQKERLINNKVCDKNERLIKNKRTANKRQHILTLQFVKLVVVFIINGLSKIQNQEGIYEKVFFEIIHHYYHK